MLYADRIIDSNRLLNSCLFDKINEYTLIQKSKRINLSIMINVKRKKIKQKLK